MVKKIYLFWDREHRTLLTADYLSKAGDLTAHRCCACAAVILQLQQLLLPRRPASEKEAVATPAVHAALFLSRAVSLWLC